MQVDYQYHGHSRMASTAGGKQIRFAANLARDIVSFDGELRYPLRFREAISALHDVVVADLRHQPRDKTAYMDWKAQEQKRLNAIREATFQAEVIRHEEARQEPNAELLRKHQSGVKEYWRARRRLQTQLARENLSLWQRLFPLDPVVTVADDVVFFEVFSQDESSYGCLTCQRDECFASTDDVSPGTTNIDYSWDLYDHFQTLRSYRQTRLTIDPTGVTAETGDERGVRMEKIDLPASWLSGFLQVQAAMTLAKVSVSLSRDAVYSLLAWLKRHRARQSPRAIRFELTPDQPVRLVLEPWDQVIESHGTPYAGSEPQSIRVWGRRRLLTLARLLPLMTSVDVYLLGTGLPSFWVVRLGEMRFTLGLSGWTANDWTGGTALDALLPPVEVDTSVADKIAHSLQSHRQATLADLQATGADDNEVFAILMRLARNGQAIFDLGAELFRWRQILPAPVDWAQLEETSPERAGAKAIIRDRQVSINRCDRSDTGIQISGLSGGRDVEIRIDADGRLTGGKCNCSHHFRNGLRKGPCRHLLALYQLNAAQREDAKERASIWSSFIFVRNSAR